MLKVFLIMAVSFGLIGCSGHARAEQAAASEADNTAYTEVVILEKGVKRTILLPREKQSDGMQNGSNSDKASSKDGIIIKFQDPSIVSLSGFEKKYSLKLQEKLDSGYYIFANVSDESDIVIVRKIINNATNIETVKPNWKMSNRPQQKLNTF